jgi:ribosome modulation factor
MPHDHMPSSRGCSEVQLRAVSTIEEFRELDEAAVLCGYMDGIQGLPFEFAELTKSYWHGWRNGAVDGGFVEPDLAQIELERAFEQLRDA